MATIIDTYHVPVLLEESVGGLDIKHDGTYVDVTFGGGGHSRRILGTGCRCGCRCAGKPLFWR